jgi:hypothetical protein
VPSIPSANGPRLGTKGWKVGEPLIIVPHNLSGILFPILITLGLVGLEILSDQEEILSPGSIDMGLLK